MFNKFGFFSFFEVDVLENFIKKISKFLYALSHFWLKQALAGLLHNVNIKFLSLYQ